MKSNNKYVPVGKIGKTSAMKLIRRERNMGLWLVLIGFMIGFLVGGFYVHYYGI